MGGADRFQHQGRRGIAQSGKDSAGMEPADSEFAEEVIPIEIARFQLAGGAVPAVGNAHRPAHAEAAFREIQPVAHRAAHAVERDPFDE